nr:unnamed protein product [Callosobruchus chinensis]
MQSREGQFDSSVT